MFVGTCVFLQQKKPETPLESTNPFLEDEAGEDGGLEKEDDLDRVRLFTFGTQLPMVTSCPLITG